MCVCVCVGEWVGGNTHHIRICVGSQVATSAQQLLVTQWVAMINDVVKAAENADPMLRDHLGFVCVLARELRPLMVWMEGAIGTLPVRDRRCTSHIGAVGETQMDQGNTTCCGLGAVVSRYEPKPAFLPER